MKTSASPIKSAVDELAALRRLFRLTLKNYATAVETDLERLRGEIAAQGTGARLSVDRVRDARDILTLLRTLDLKPAKGRRRDLKKIEGVVEEVQGIVKNW